MVEEAENVRATEELRGWGLVQGCWEPSRALRMGGAGPRLGIVRALSGLVEDMSYRQGGWAGDRVDPGPVPTWEPRRKSSFVVPGEPERLVKFLGERSRRHLVLGLRAMAESKVFTRKLWLRQDLNEHLAAPVTG